MAADSPTASDVRKFVLVQWSLTVLFLAVVWWLSGSPSGTDVEYPPVWFIAALMVVVIVCAVLADRTWLRIAPLRPGHSDEQTAAAAMEAFVRHLLRTLLLAEIPLFVAVLASIVKSGDWGGWPIVIVATPGLAVLFWETWPHLRITSRVAAMLDADGADSRLIERFARR